MRYVQGGQHDLIPLTAAGTGWETAGGWECPAAPERSEQRVPSARERRVRVGLRGQKAAG